MMSYTLNNTNIYNQAADNFEISGIIEDITTTQRPTPPTAPTARPFEATTPRPMRRKQNLKKSLRAPSKNFEINNKRFYNPKYFFNKVPTRN